MWNTLIPIVESKADKYVSVSGMITIVMQVSGNEYAFSGLTLLLGRQEEHPCKKFSVACWHSYLSGARCR